MKPETVLRWKRQLIKHFWTCKVKRRVGRPPVKNEIKQLILAMKNDNLYWGHKKIQGELLKLGVELDKKTIQNILTDFRRKGKIKQPITWRQFLKQQIHSLYAMDFFTIDTVYNQQYYVFYIIYHKTKEIMHFAITKNLNQEFVRQQLIEFEQTLNGIVYMIHNRASQFTLNYLSFGIKELRHPYKPPT